MTTTLFLMFGSLRGWDERFSLRLDLEDASDVLTPTTGGRFGTVRVGPEVTYGPIVMDSPGRSGRTIILYGGENIPDWATGGMPAGFGWERAEDIPIGMSNPLMEIDALVLRFTSPDQITAWIRTIWRPEAPRPLERIEILAGDEDGPTLSLRTLEVGIEPADDGRKIPYAVFSSPTPLDEDEMRSNGWIQEPWTHDRDDEWRHLHQLCDAAEVFTEPLLGYSLVSSAKIHDFSKLDAITLADLPKDVRDALAAELQKNPPPHQP